MKAKVKLVDGFTIVELSGYLDYESAPRIKQSIRGLFSDNAQAQVLIDIKDLQFVGSTGVSTFVKDMKAFNTLKMKPFYYGVKSEFLKLFRAFEDDDDTFEVMQNEQEATDAAQTRRSKWLEKQARKKIP